jgi:hypothetical protein
MNMEILAAVGAGLLGLGFIIIYILFSLFKDAKIIIKRIENEEESD